MNIRSKSWLKLKYYDPADILRKLRAVEMKYPVSELPYKVSSLRTKSLKTRGESRQCALFCHGMAQYKGLTLSYAESEESDYDFVVFCAENSSFVPVQMKELVPEKLNPDTDLQKEIDKLSKYVDSGDLCVALYLNRELKSLGKVCTTSPFYKISPNFRVNGVKRSNPQFISACRQPFG